MEDIKRAKDLLSIDGTTLALCKGSWTHTSRERGIRPMVDFICGGVGPKGFCAADKVVGKAASLLFVLAGAGQVYAEVMSEGAIAVFETHGISWSCDTKTEHIINRQGTGLCPMEQAVSGTDNPSEALAAIKCKLAELSASSKSSDSKIKG